VTRVSAKATILTKHFEHIQTVNGFVPNDCVILVASPLIACWYLLATSEFPSQFASQACHHLDGTVVNAAIQGFWEHCHRTFSRK
jgi:hypothetical protein